jgi:hypothetical protein
MKSTYAVLLAVTGLALVSGVAAADQSMRPVTDADRSVGPVADTDRPEWPGEETTTNESDENGERDDATVVSPGQQLTGAVGAQGASVQGELLNRSLSERLANASTPDRRAEVVVNETESLAAYLDALEGVRENVTEAWEADELSEGEYRAALAEFVVRAHTVELRANRTARTAEDLPERTRREYAIDVTRIWNLNEAARDLYQFDDPVEREVVNETLGEERDERAFPLAGGRSDGNWSDSDWSDGDWPDSNWSDGNESA